LWFLRLLENVGRLNVDIASYNFPRFITYFAFVVYARY